MNKNFAEFFFFHKLFKKKTSHDQDNTFCSFFLWVCRESVLLFAFCWGRLYLIYTEKMCFSKIEFGNLYICLQVFKNAVFYQKVLNLIDFEQKQWWYVHVLGKKWCRIDMFVGADSKNGSFLSKLSLLGLKRRNIKNKDFLTKILMNFFFFII